MENRDFENEEMLRQMKKRYTRGKVLGGLLLVTAGFLFLARELGAAVPHWIFTWKTLLIAIGLVAGAKRAFSPGGWMVAVLVGAGFLVNDFYPELEIRAYLWPIILIGAGLVVMLRPFRPRDHHWRRWHARCAEKKNFMAYETSNDDFLESTTVFGSVQKNVFSKNFRGGDVTNVMGGTEINLSQADFHGVANLEVTQVIGGTRLIVPPHWQIRSTMTAVLGEVNDKRPHVPPTAGQEKILQLSGTSVLGGIEIRSI